MRVSEKGWRVGRNPSLSLVIFHFLVFVLVVFLHSLFFTAEQFWKFYFCP